MKKVFFCKKRRLSTAFISKSNHGNEDTLRNEIDHLKKKVEELSKRVEELENPKIELVDLTNDSFDTTISVHSEDLIEVPNGIWKNGVRLVVADWLKHLFRHRKIKIEAFLLMFKDWNTLTLYNVCCCF